MEEDGKHGNSMNVRANLGTGTGFYALFEIDQLSTRAGTEVDWFVYRDVKVALANEGKAVFIEVGIDDVFLFRLTTDDLTETERAALRQSEDRFWLDVKGHELIFTSSEAVPNQQQDPAPFINEFGTRIPIEPGHHRVVVHRLIGPHNPGVVQLLERSEERVPAYVIVFRPLAEGDVPPRLDMLPSLSPLLEEEDLE
jgi:hypothetical protein